MEERVEDYIKRIEIIIETLSDHIEFEDYDEDVLKEASKDKEAIEKLLKDYKELKEENKELKKQLEEKDMQHELELIGKEEYTKASMGEIIEHYYTANEDCIPTSVIQKYKEKFLEDSKNEEVFMTQSTQINASLISFCDELLEERNK